MTNTLSEECGRLEATNRELRDALMTARAIIDKDIDLTDADYDQICRAIAKAEKGG